MEDEDIVITTKKQKSGIGCFGLVLLLAVFGVLTVFLVNNNRVASHINTATSEQVSQQE